MDVAMLVFAAALPPALWLLWLRRRRTARLPTGDRPDPSAGTRSAPDVIATPVDIAPVPRLHPLLRQLYAATMHAPELAEAPVAFEGVQAQVFEQAKDLLDCLDLQPQYMPRRPHLLPQLMRAVNDPAASGHAIATIIAQDPALATNLLRIANSALYRPHGAATVDSLDRGVALIGTDGVRQIVATALMQPVLSLDGGLFSQLPSAIWQYALHAAAAGADHAGRHGHGDDALSAQLLGLLQGLGAVVVIRVLQETYARHAGAPASLAVATALLDRYTIATARTVTAGWDLPPALGQALMDQRPQRDGIAPATPLATAVRYGRLAAVLAALVRAGQESEAHALALLATLEPDTQANAILWTRLRATAEPG
jgi:HD-like signal output (HDOD) protein